MQQYDNHFKTVTMTIVSQSQGAKLTRVALGPQYGSTYYWVTEKTGEALAYSR